MCVGVECGRRGRHPPQVEAHGLACGVVGLTRKGLWTCFACVPPHVLAVMRAYCVSQSLVSQESLLPLTVYLPASRVRV